MTTAASSMWTVRLHDRDHHPFTPLAIHHAQAMFGMTPYWSSTREESIVGSTILDPTTTGLPPKKLERTSGWLRSSALPPVLSLTRDGGDLALRLSSGVASPSQVDFLRFCAIVLRGELIAFTRSDDTIRSSGYGLRTSQSQRVSTRLSITWASLIVAFRDGRHLLTVRESDFCSALGGLRSFWNEDRLHLLVRMWHEMGDPTHIGPSHKKPDIWELSAPRVAAERFAYVLGATRRPPAGTTEVSLTRLDPGIGPAPLSVAV
jgi:hypothetical protein